MQQNIVAVFVAFSLAFATFGTASVPRVAAQAQDVTLTGEFLIVWGDPGPGSKLKEVAIYTLFDDQGQTTELDLDEKVARPAGGPLALDKKPVVIEGQVVGPKKVKVKAIKPDKSKKPKAEAAAADAVSSPKPWVTILCRFADVPATPQPLSFFQGLMGSLAPGLNHYFREDSYNAVNLNGNLVVGWYNLPSPRSAYLPGGNLDFNKALNDCTAVADANVFFPDFIGINLMFNADLDCCAWGGSAGLTRDGQTKSYSVTWMPPWGWGNQSVMAHEMGHGFGLPHSSGPYAATYDSQWDVMSSTWRCLPPHTVYGCVGPHTISYHKDVLAWVPAGDKYRVNASGTHNLTIAQLSTPASVNDYLMAEVPIDCSPQFYTVESRRFVGYDVYLPGEAVVIHQVDTTRPDRLAQVVDPDNNGDPNDAGAMWLPGETFTDASNGISIAVTGATATGWTVSINSPGGGDGYEPNSVWDEARLFTVGSTETHGFCIAGDEDWVYFQATAGTPYRIETLNLQSPTDTVLELYDPSLNFITSDDDGGGFPNSLINFTPSTSGTYYIKARQFAGGAASTYDLRITVNVPPPCNLLCNSSFELDTTPADGKPDSWSTNNKFTRSNEIAAHDGSFVGRFRATDNSGANSTQTVLNLTAGTTYNFSGWVNIPTQGDTTFTFKIQVIWKNASNSTISTTLVKNYTTTTGGNWNNDAVKTMVAPAGTVKAVVKMVASSLNGSIYVDHFDFK